MSGKGSHRPGSVDFSRLFTWNELINGSSKKLQMELRAHGGPALVFPSFRKVLCWEQLPGAAQQLLIPGSTALGSAVALVCGNQRGGSVLVMSQGLSSLCAGKSGWALLKSSESL